MATVSPEQLPPIAVGSTFTTTISVAPSTIGEIITGVTAALDGEPAEADITITGGSSSVTISGKHMNTFKDFFTYLEPGTTLQDSTPTEVQGRGNVPPNKNLFDTNLDKRGSQIRTFKVNITTTLGSSTVNVTQEVLNTLDAMKDFMANYSYKGA